jgi:hypothetical protein
VAGTGGRGIEPTGYTLPPMGSYCRGCATGGVARSRTPLHPRCQWFVATGMVACRLFGAPAIHLVLEAVEVYGVRKYLDVWDRFGDGPLGPALRSVLDDEFRHGGCRGDGRRGAPHRSRAHRNIFLGLNDGLVEILGSVSGFFGAFGNTGAVLAASATVAVARVSTSASSSAPTAPSGSRPTAGASTGRTSPPARGHPRRCHPTAPTQEEQDEGRHPLRDGEVRRDRASSVRSARPQRPRGP